MDQTVINGTLIKIHIGGYCISISTYSRTHRVYRRFLISKDQFTTWLFNQQDRGAFYDRDIYNFLESQKRSDFVNFSITWLEGGSEALRGYCESFTIPIDILKEYLRNVSEDEHNIEANHTETIFTYLYVPNKRQSTKLNFSNASRSIKAILTDKHLRRAFIKGLRDNYNYFGNSSITFYNDCCNDSFYFEETSDQWQTRGGFIHHESRKTINNEVYPYHYYSVHT